MNRIWSAPIAALAAAAILAACQTAPPARDATGLPPAAAATTLTPEAALAPSLRASAAGRPTTTFSPETLAQTRVARASTAPLPTGVEERMIPGPAGAPDVKVLIANPDTGEAKKPAYLHMHGGGYIIGTAAQSAARMPDLAKDCLCVVVSVDYRLAPETKFPGPMEDNFAALKWLHDNAATLGVDPARIAVGGESAGGGHAAQLAIAARDRGVPVAFQVLIYPMLDDRTGSTRPAPGHIGHYIWNSGSNRFAWEAYLGQPAGSPNPPAGAVPARVENLAGLPPAWIGVGSVDLFFAEDLEYARRLGEAGVPVEVLVVPGAYHAFDSIAATAAPARQFTASWRRALKEALHPTAN